MDPFRKLYYTLQSVANHPLHQCERWRAMWRFSAAQLAVRLVPGEVCVPFPNRTKLLVPPRMKGAAHFISPGLCEFQEMCFVTHFLKPDELFADVGANIGAFTVLASGVAGARTAACEPNSRTFESLLQNVRLNNLLEKVTALNVALGRSEGVLRLTDNLGTENYVCPESEQSGGVQVKVTTLDQVFASATPALIKIDVEGFESEVIAGAAGLLKRPALEAMIVERSGMGRRYGYDEEPLHRLIRDSGFTPCGYSAFERRLAKVSPEAQGNIIYVRNVETAQARLTSAPQFHYGEMRI